MAYCVAGGVQLPILTTADTGFSAERIGGEHYRTYNGALRDSSRGVKRTWNRTTMPINATAYDAILAVIGSPAGGNVVSCTGDMFRGGAVNCAVVVTNAPERKAWGETPKLKYSVQLQFIEA
jgi:hypothetical protein